jgi:hypothetical protein
VANAVAAVRLEVAVLADRRVGRLFFVVDFLDLVTIAGVLGCQLSQGVHVSE